MNKEITVEHYEINPSKHSNFSSENCLKLQIVFNGEKRIVFTGSSYLIDAIKRVDKKDFPFLTTILEIDERFEFT